MCVCCNQKGRLKWEETKDGKKKIDYCWHMTPEETKGDQDEGPLIGRAVFRKGKRHVTIGGRRRT